MGSAASTTAPPLGGLSPADVAARIRELGANYAGVAQRLEAAGVSGAALERMDAEQASALLWTLQLDCLLGHRCFRVRSKANRVCDNINR